MPKAKTPSAYLSDHETPEAAIEQAIADARSESAAARRFKRAYTPLVETLKLSASIEDSDDAVSAARDAARDALGELTADPDTDDSPALALLDNVLEAIGLSPDALHDALGKLPDDATEQQFSDLLTAYTAPVREPLREAQSLKSELVYSRAAGTEYDPAKLQKIAPGLTAREVEQDGQKVTEYGIPGEKDAWTPLADAISGWEASLKRDGTAPPKPEPKPLPTGGAGGKAEPVSVIQQRIQARQQTQATAPDPFKPTPGGNT